jgi:hypothetical protein
VNSLVDNSLVALALLVSAGYTLISLGPRSLRRQLLAALSRATARAPRFLGLQRTARWLAASADKAAGACGGCDDCGAEKAAAKKPAAAEITVPMAKIGRRA